LVGLVGTLSSYFIRFIPPLFPYAGLIKTIGIVLLVAGVYFRGGYGVEMEWRNKVAELEAKVAKSEEKSKEINTVIQKVYVDKVKVVKDVQIVIQEKIVEKTKIIDAECKVAPEALEILNEAAKNPGTSK
jgi:preprotein translocase subunit SecF